MRNLSMGLKHGDGKHSPATRKFRKTYPKIEYWIRKLRDEHPLHISISSGGPLDSKQGVILSSPYSVLRKDSITMAILSIHLFEYRFRTRKYGLFDKALVPTANRSYEKLDTSPSPDCRSLPLSLRAPSSVSRRTRLFHSPQSAPTPFGLVDRFP